MKTAAANYYEENPGEGDMQGVIPNMRNTTFDQQTATNVKNHLHLVDVGTNPEFFTSKLLKI